MNPFVFDASVALSWCFTDEADAAGDAVLSRLALGRACVPAIWPFEVANVLLGAERRGRISAGDANRFLSLLAALPIDVDPHSSARALGDVMLLARTHKLTSYDASYLDLAVRGGLAIATRDQRLSAAAREVGLEMLIPGP